jgi:large subunit ribosomal protein L29
MKAEELKTKTLDELKKLLMDLKKKQFNLRFQRSQGQLDNTAEIRHVRRDIARVKTFMEQQDRADQGPSKAKASKAPAKKSSKKAA